VDVIRFPHRSKWRAYSYLEGGQNVVRQWIEAEDIPVAELATLVNLIDLYEANGPVAIDQYTKDLGDGFYGLVVLRKGGTNPVLIFCEGPIDKEFEITFLAGGFWRGKTVRPYHAIGYAKEHFETLRHHPDQRIHEPIA
jgi:hypothetical protein